MPGNNKIQNFSQRWRQSIQAAAQVGLTEEARAYLSRTDSSCSVCHAPSRIGRRWWKAGTPNFRLLRTDGTEVTFRRWEKVLRSDSWFLGGDAKAGGRHVPVGVPYGVLNPQGGLQIQCKNCGHTWPYYRWDASKPVKSVEPQIKITPTEKSEELVLPTDQWTVDNSRSSAEVQQRDQVERQWSKTVTVAYEEATKDVQGISINAPVGVGTVSLNKAIEAQLRQAYTLSGTETETKTREVVVTVPPHKKVRVTIEWIQIWQHGRIELHYPTDNRGYDELPFKVAIEMRSHQSTEDVT